MVGNSRGVGWLLLEDRQIDISVRVGDTDVCTLQVKLFTGSDETIIRIASCVTTGAEIFFENPNRVIVYICHLLVASNTTAIFLDKLLALGVKLFLLEYPSKR